MNLELTADQVELRELVRGYLAEKAPIDSHVRALLEDPTGGAATPVWRGLADLGVTGVLVPEDQSGLGLGMLEAGLVAEELGRALYPGPWLSTAVAATKALTRLDNPTDTVAALLATVADGSAIAIVALDSIHRPATVAAGPGGPLLTGRFADTPDAAAADVLLVFAADDGGTGLYAVDTTDPGLRISTRPGIDATRKRFTVELDRAPGRRLGAALAHHTDALIDDVLAVAAADALGAAQALFDHTRAYAGTRVQFGKPIGTFQAVQHLCVDMFETVELARGGVLYALWAADSAPRPQAHAAAVHVKAFAGKLAALADTAIQIFGGIGFTWEHDAHLYFKRLLGWNTFLGNPNRYLHQAGAQLISAAAAP